MPVARPLEPVQAETDALVTLESTLTVLACAGRADVTLATFARIVGTPLLMLTWSVSPLRSCVTETLLLGSTTKTFPPLCWNVPVHGVDVLPRGSPHIPDR